MTRRLGLSSNTCPHWSAGALLQFATTVPPTFIDLRLGRHQEWHSARAGVVQLLASGRVGFVATDVVVGAGGWSSGLDHVRWYIDQAVTHGVPVRLKLPNEGHAGILRSAVTDIAEVRAAYPDSITLLLETHYEWLTLGDLVSFARSCSLRIVLDMLGATRMQASRDELLDVASHCDAIQVKGFVQGAVGAWERRPFREAPDALALTRDLVALSADGLPITLETSPVWAADDLALLNDL